MGILTDMLPQMEASSRTLDILTYLGCARLGCRINVHDDIAWVGRWVRHNDETRFFADIIEPDPVTVYAGKQPIPVAYIPRVIAAWITQQHPAIEASREAERQVAIDADPWRQHAVMVALDA